MRRGIFIVLAVLVVMTVASAGCFDSIDLSPSEVQNRGNIIAIDSTYVEPSIIVGLLMDPMSYQYELNNAIDKYLPNDKPVVHVGVGIGVTMANISNKLHLPKEHVAVTPNPYMIPLLQDTINKNALVVNLQQKAVAYDVAGATEVPFTVSKNLQANKVMAEETKETIMVPATTVCELISSGNFNDVNNVTLVVETPGLVKTILEKEPEIHDNVSVIIGVTSTSTKQDIAKIMNKALVAGYSPVMVSDPDENDNCVMVFKR